MEISNPLKKNEMRSLTKHIVIDGTPAINDIRAIKRYCRHLILEIDQLETEFQFLLLYLAVKKNSRLPSTNSPHATRITSRIPGRMLFPLWQYLNAPPLSWWIKHPVDLIHFPGGLPYIPVKCDNILTTLHGFSCYLIPEYIDQTFIKKTKKEFDFTISKSTHFITVSEANKQEAMRLWDIPQEKITAIPLGVSPEFRVYDLSGGQKQTTLKKYNLPDKPIILFVGALEPHKNIKNIILAFHKLPVSLLKRYQLVLVGRESGYCEGYRELTRSLGLSDKVSFVDYIEPGSLDLAYLYNMAALFVFPTFYEGWASPPLEAMRCGTPVIASDIPSLRESTGGNAMYPDPHSLEEISNSMRLLLEDKLFYKEQREKGSEFAMRHTWKQCAEKTLKLYNQLLDA